eukprot:GFUD01040321.1.p1 GENE.GFUD01040321.1~~GFUD01040321.1.p1  ORF type:complete len:483 (+),score=79.24 GFUD01040321.1:79-1449(+)
MDSPNETSSLLPTKLPTSRSSSSSSQSKKPMDLLDVPSSSNRKKRSPTPQVLSGRRSIGSANSSRMRTNSVAVFNDLEDSTIVTVSTSYGPVVVDDSPIPGYGGAVGLILAAFSGILFTVNNFLFQYYNLNVTDMLLTRSGLQTAVLGLLLVLTGCNNFLPVRCMDWFLVVSQSIFSGARVGLTFACLGFLPLGDALTIIFSEPLWTLLLSKIFLKTRIGWWKFSFAFVLIAGVILCTQPPFLFPISQQTRHHHHYGHHLDHHGYHHHHHHFHRHEYAIQVNETTVGVDAEAKVTMMDEDCSYYIGVLLAVGAALTGSASNVIVAKCEKISTTAICTYSGVGGVVLAVAYGVLVDTEDKIIPSVATVTAEEWLTLLMLGGMGLVGFFALTRSLHLIPPTTVAVLRALEIVLAYGVQAVVLGEVPDSLAMAGSSLVIVSVVAFAAENFFLTCIGGRM